ncbi:MAG: DUF4397 domain-containing protein [Velocimicrobium sp.]
MYYNQYANTNNNNNNPSPINRNQQMNSYIRLLHAAPNAPSVDVYMNDSLIAKDLAYGEYSDYLAFPTGNYTITVYPSGQMNSPVIDTSIFIPSNGIFTIAVTGVLPDLSLYPIQEPITGQQSGKACVRFAHLSPDAPNVDIKQVDGPILFADVANKNITNYICIPEGTYSFDILLAGTNDSVLTVPNVELKGNNYYTVYVLGLANESPALKTLILPEPRY